MSCLVGRPGGRIAIVALVSWVDGILNVPRLSRLHLSLEEKSERECGNDQRSRYVLGWRSFFCH